MTHLKGFHFLQKNSAFIVKKIHYDIIRNKSCITFMRKKLHAFVKVSVIRLYLWIFTDLFSKMLFQIYVIREVMMSNKEVYILVIITSIIIYAKFKDPFCTKTNMANVPKDL